MINCNNKRKMPNIQAKMSGIPEQRTAELERDYNATVDSANEHDELETRQKYI